MSVVTPEQRALEGSKVLVLDNQLINSLSEAQMKEIKKYVSDGGGLVVVGGEKAYNYGNYLNSSLEEILPVLSKPSEYKGGRNLVLILDVSPSTHADPRNSGRYSRKCYLLFFRTKISKMQMLVLSHSEARDMMFPEGLYFWGFLRTRQS